MDKTIVLGNLGNDCVVNTVQGKSVINFNVGRSYKYKKDGVTHSRSKWYNCSWWIDNVSIAQYLKKGTQVLVEGEAEATVYTTNDGKHLPQLRLRVLSLTLAGGPKESSNQTQQSQSQQSYTVSESPDITESLSDLPF